MKIFFGQHKQDNSYGFFLEEDLEFCTNPVEISEEERQDILDKQSQGWVLKVDNKGYPYVEIVEPSLKELKEAKRAEINAARDAAEQGGFEYMGKMFDSDQISCQRIALASQKALISKQANQEFLVEWTCQDNSKIILSTDEIIGLSMALANWSNFCHVKARELKVLVDEIETKEEIDAISWDMKITPNDGENN